MAAGEWRRTPHADQATALKPGERQAWPVVTALALSGALLAAVLILAIHVRTDMADFLPRGETAAARLMLQEAGSGAASGMILMGIEDAPPAALARISRAMAADLSGSGLFALVLGGDAALPEPAAMEALFTHRYLLSPVDPDAAFSEPALRTALQSLLRQLGSSTAALAVQFGLADPTGAFLGLLRGWVGATPLRTVDGAWFAVNRDRALLLARTRAGGMDISAQRGVAQAIEVAFMAASPGTARLLVTGPAVFARDAASAMQADVERISLLSTVLVAALLWWRFRSPLVIAAIAVPVVLSIAAAALVVQLVFGMVHGVALGFGITMLGISVDYPVLMIGHRKAGEAAIATRARIGAAFILAVTTATLGLGAMVFSGFPGLSQLGVFAAVGLTTAALATWWVLPYLVIVADLAPVSAGDAAWLAPLEALRRWRLLGLLPILAALIYLGARGGPDWEGDLQTLSPVPAASRAMDMELRAQFGAAEVSRLIVVRGPDPQTVLRRQEVLLPVLAALQTQGALAGTEMAARLLPSAAHQEARRAALPDRSTLAARQAAAGAGLPFRAETFTPFIDAVDRSRSLAPLLPGDLAGTPLGLRLDLLLVERDGEWQGPIALQGVRDAAAIRAAVAGIDGAFYVDVREELGAILTHYTRQAWQWLAWSGLLVQGVLAIGLRDRGRVLRVLGTVGAAMLVTAAVLTLSGSRLSLLHLIALQLVAGVGFDYAVFFSRRLLDAEERIRTLRTLVTCNAMTLLTFGLLAACETPLLRDIGSTVAIGAALAMVFGFLFAGERQVEGLPE
jgi:predicted exporter